MSARPARVYIVTSPRSVLLGGYPAKQCVMRTHHEFDPNVTITPDVSATVRSRMDDGILFEDEVVVPAMVDMLGERCVAITYGDHRADKARRVTETMAAMEAGVEVIIGGQLPDDTEGGRTGSPDLLFRVSKPGEFATYVPADVKNHSTLKAGGRITTTVSGMGDGFMGRTQAQGFTHSTHRAGDCMQLAHYTRMLEACGRHPGPHMLTGAILGTSNFTDLTCTRYGLVWHDLSVATEKTWTSSGAGSVKRSILDVYDYEFGLRVRVAQAARDGEPALVRPFGKAECGECPFAELCREQAGPVDASFAVTKGHLTEREWRYLYSRGIDTVEALATVKVQGDLLAGYLAAASNMPQPEKRLAEAVKRARMVRDQVAFERLHPAAPAVVVPAADVEIDFDVEWDGDGHVYQWGVRVRYDSDESTATYEHTVVSFNPLDDDSAAALAEEFFTWMETFIADHEAAGRSVAVYHWTNPETSHTARMLGSERSDRLFARRFLDQKTWMAQHYTARDGFSLKVVAPVFGFAWSVDDAGGELATLKIDEARRHPDPMVREKAREWLLAYNESDCAAQAAIRDGVRAVAAVGVIHEPVNA